MERKISYVWVLWTGVALWLVSALIRLARGLFGGEVSGQDVLFDAIGSVDAPITMAVLFVLIGAIVPVLEEFLFRCWIKSKRTALTIVLFAAMGCYVAISTFWSLGLLCFVSTLLVYVVFGKSSNVQTVTLMFQTSLFFSAAHITGFSVFDLDSTLCLCELFGLGLVACWLVYNTNFWYACLLHAANNIVALLLILASSAPNAPVEISFETPLYSASLKPIATEGIDFREIDDSTVVVTGKLPTIALDLVRKFNPDIVMGLYSPTEVFDIELAYKKNPYWEYTLTFHDTIPYRHAPQLVTDLARHSRLQIDTTYEDMYILGIEDPVKVNESEGEERNLASLAEDIRIFYDCPVVLEKGTNEFYPIKYDDDLLSYPCEMRSLPSILSDKLGLFIYKSDVHKIQAVYFSENFSL